MPPRSRNFDGCWTCRTRKLKCDATRPKCLRCTKANLVCKGYNIVLVWADNATIGHHNQMILVPMSRDTETQRDSGSSRRNVDLVKFPPAMTYETYDQLSKVVAQLDTIGVAAKKKSFVSGPFSVYSISPEKTQSHNQGPVTGVPAPMSSKPKAPKVARNTSFLKEGSRMKKKPRLPVKAQPGKPHTPADFGSVDQGKSRENSPFNLKSDGELQTHPPYVFDADPEASIFSKTDNAYVHYELLDFTKLTILAIKGPRYKFSEQGMFHILYPNFFPNIESDDWKPHSDVLSSCILRNNTGQVILPPVLHTAMAYLSSGVLAITRTSHARSSWNKLVIPFLKQIFFDIVFEEYPKQRGWQNLIIPKAMDHVPRDLLLRNLKLAIFCLTISLSLYAKSCSGPRMENRTDSLFINDDLRRSIELRKFAINILNYHLDEYHDNSQPSPDDGYDCYFLLALILQIHTDNIYEVFENFELIYAIGDFILKKPTSGSKQMSQVERHLRNKFNVLNVFYESTQAINFFNYSIPEKDTRSKYSDLNENYDLTAEVSAERDDSSVISDVESESHDYESNVKVASNSDSSRPLSLVVNFGPKPQPPKADSFSDIQAFSNQMNEIPEGSNFNLTRHSGPIDPKEEDGSIYVDFGIPKSLIQLFHETVQLTNHKNVFKSKGVTPRNFPRICADMQDRIFNWNVETYWKLYDNEYNPISNVTTRIFVSDFHQGLYHNVVAFHNALKVYFMRLIPGSPIEGYQNHISACFASMRQLVGLTHKLKTQNRNLRYHPSFWPLLVCGCDIDIETRPELKEECQRLWKSPCFSAQNNWRSKQILYEVWHRRLEDKENNGFMDMIREWAIVLSLG